MKEPRFTRPPDNEKWLADVVFWSFVVLILAIAVVLLSTPSDLDDAMRAHFRQH